MISYAQILIFTAYWLKASTVSDFCASFCSSTLLSRFLYTAFGAHVLKHLYTSIVAHLSVFGGKSVTSTDIGMSGQSLELLLVFFWLYAWKQGSTSNLILDHLYNTFVFKTYKLASGVTLKHHKTFIMLRRTPRCFFFEKLWLATQTMAS